MVTKSNVKVVEREIRESKKEYEQSQTRVSKLDTIIQKLYEDNVEGKISDERFAKMLAIYETEQSQLTHRLAELGHIIDAAKQKFSNADRFLRLVKTYTDIKELNSEIIRTFIEKIYVYGNEKPWDRNTKKLKVIFNFIGEVHIPSDVKKGIADYYDYADILQDYKSLIELPFAVVLFYLLVRTKISDKSVVNLNKIAL
ncbi:hypothetical protein CIRMBP1270_00470 [Enterococcus cecorum]|nr:hypothetical protein CIRMBP1244_00288 [Enterococcus cecorum]CAI3280317.1 hypothetical protein CIRMBP1282_00418 [Enterococcus cecorum]CAI3283805.1 hypothetical protein CIRMBP1270_00470 [Enterococcus cecorum]CAI3292785.1 hypothetical protein CIRMBP1222_00473 [Enterococcus cecorum]CAI3299033.1 hypothetical protein CIRMBP1237_00548 [Enterococcus cecorum]